MSTSNFFKNNARNYYAILEHVDDGEDYDPFFWYDYKESISDMLYSDHGYNMDGKTSDWRNTTALAGKWYEASEYGDIFVSIVLRHGYYEGGNLDYEIYYEGSEYDADDIDAIADEIAEAVEDKRSTKRVRREALEAIQKAIDEAESICATYCTDTLVCTARFSNGETWYGPVPKSELPETETAKASAVAAA